MLQEKQYSKGTVTYKALSQGKLVSIPLRYGITIYVRYNKKLVVANVSIPLRYGITNAGKNFFIMLTMNVSIPHRYGITFPIYWTDKLKIDYLNSS